MNRLTDNDRSFGPFTFARWKKQFSIALKSADDDGGESAFLMVAFGFAIRCKVPNFLIPPYQEKKTAHGWDAETVARLGRNWYYRIHQREFGISLSDLGNGYDFLSVHFGAQTGDSSTEKSWCTHLPWKQWRGVRWSLFDSQGKVFATGLQTRGYFQRFFELKNDCPKSYFGFEDQDGEMIVATCVVEERESHRGIGLFKWLSWFYPAHICRSLCIEFSAEVGREKASYKGGITGHATEMIARETARHAFERYCLKHKLRFIGPCSKPDQKISSDATSTKSSIQ